MDIKSLIELNEKIPEISDKEEKMIKNEISKYKYVPIFYILLSKLYLDQNNINYNKSLIFASLYSSNRSQLKKYLKNKKDKIILIESSEEKIFEGEDLAIDSKNFKLDHPTETLAQIFEKKNKFLPAIQIYRQLCINFPEKKLYFTNIINKLKDKLDNYS